MVFLNDRVFRQQIRVKIPKVVPNGRSAQLIAPTTRLNFRDLHWAILRPDRIVTIPSAQLAATIRPPIIAKMARITISGPALVRFGRDYTKKYGDSE